MFLCLCLNKYTHYIPYSILCRKLFILSCLNKYTHCTPSCAENCVYSWFICVFVSNFTTHQVAKYGNVNLSFTIFPHSTPGCSDVLSNIPLGLTFVRSHLIPSSLDKSNFLFNLTLCFFSLESLLNLKYLLYCYLKSRL